MKIDTHNIRLKKIKFIEFMNAYEIMILVALVIMLVTGLLILLKPVDENSSAVENIILSISPMPEEVKVILLRLLKGDVLIAICFNIFQLFMLKKTRYLFLLFL